MRSRAARIGAVVAAALTIGAVAMVQAPHLAGAAEPQPVVDGSPLPATDLVGEPSDGVSAAAAKYRNFSIKTSDKAPGGRFDGRITWSGAGPYYGKVTGTVLDREADGYCVIGLVWADGLEKVVSGQACPYNSSTDHRNVNWSYKNKKKVLVMVCLVKDGKRNYCSRWS